jgi:hypothetical protein
MAGENYINHVALVLDASTSMRGHTRSLIAVADGQVKYLAQRSRELDQETRVSIYVFGSTVKCLVYDKDVLRLPSIASLYSPDGMTALADATILSLDDLAMTPEKYGDHAFLVWVLTDGQENKSSPANRRNLPVRLRSLPENYTVGVLVPDQRGVFEAKGFGFPADNIAVWDTSSAAGVVEAGETIRSATDNFMQARTRGVRSTRSLFSTGLDAVNPDTVRRTLTVLPESRYDVVPVHTKAQIRPYIQSRGLPYTVGKGFYELMKTEKIQPGKQIAVQERGTGRVFTGPDARHLLGLPDNVEVKVKPEANPLYKIFVQSTSVNRNLIPGTEVLVLR